MLNMIDFRNHSELVFGPERSIIFEIISLLSLFLGFGWEWEGR